MNGLRDRRWLIRLVLAAWIGSSLFAAYLLYQLNGIVHGTLYSYGLQFSNNWAAPYWTIERLLYVCLFVPSSIGGLTFVLDLWGSRREKPPVMKRAKSQVPVPASKVADAAPRVTSKDNSKKIKCPKCQRTLSKSLNMLDFSSGKARMVDVCPYCNHILAGTEGTDTNIRVLEPEKRKEIH